MAEAMNLFTLSAAAATLPPAILNVYMAWKPVGGRWGWCSSSDAPGRGWCVCRRRTPRCGRARGCAAGSTYGPASLCGSVFFCRLEALTRKQARVSQCFNCLVCCVNCLVFSPLVFNLFRSVKHQVRK